MLTPGTWTIDKVAVYGFATNYNQFNSLVSKSQTRLIQDAAF